MLFSDPNTVSAMLLAIIGALATIFALIASTSVLMYQQVASTSPTSLKYFPHKILIGFLAALVTLMTVGGVLYFWVDSVRQHGSVLWASGTQTPQGAMVIPGTAVVQVFLMLSVFSGGYVVYVVALARKWFDPRYTIDRISERIMGADDHERLTLITSLNELAATYTTQGYTKTVKPLLAAYEKLVEMSPHVSGPPTNLDEDQETEADPLSRLIPSIGQFAVHLCRNQLETFAPRTAYVLMTLMLDKGLDSHRQWRLQLTIRRVFNEFLSRDQHEAAGSFVRKIMRRIRDSGGRLQADQVGNMYLGLLEIALHHENFFAIRDVLVTLGTLSSMDMAIAEFLDAGVRQVVARHDLRNKSPNLAKWVQELNLNNEA